MRTTDPKKKDSIEQPIVCTRQNLKPDCFDCHHLGDTTLRATALDLRSEDYESKTCKPLVENPCCSASHRCFIDTLTNWGLTAKWSHQDGRRKFLGFKNETIEGRPVMRTNVRTSRPDQPVRKTTSSVPPYWKLPLAKLILLLKDNRFGHRSCSLISLPRQTEPQRCISRLVDPASQFWQIDGAL